MKTRLPVIAHQAAPEPIEPAGPLERPDVMSLDDLDRLTRRQICGAAATGLVAMMLPSCVGGSIVDEPAFPGRPNEGTSRNPAGSGGPGSADPGPAVAASSRPDAGAPDTAGAELVGDPRPPSSESLDSRPATATPGPRLDGGGADAGTIAACGGTSSTSMPPSAFALDTATFFARQRLFLCRDPGGLYAVTAVCTHNGCIVGFSGAGAGFRCPCHGSRFDFTGTVTNGPANSPLRHFLVCVGADGAVRVDTSEVVNPSVRLLV
jgi:nitrite reductase/ring-hydroxylating ferredoxin subunit